MKTREMLAEDVIVYIRQMTATAVKEAVEAERNRAAGICSAMAQEIPAPVMGAVYPSAWLSNVLREKLEQAAKFILTPEPQQKRRQKVRS